MDNEITEIENEAKAASEGLSLSQYTIHITREQAEAIRVQLIARRQLGGRVSFSDIVRELIDTGYQGVAETTDALLSMRGKGRRVRI